LLISATGTESDTSKDVADVVRRQKRDLYDGSDALFDIFDLDRMPVISEKRFDPFQYGSSDRFSHGFGKRHITNGVANTLVYGLYMTCSK